MNDDLLKVKGVKNLQKTQHGRDYLTNLRKENEIDLLQPGDPKFDRVYGDKIRKQESRLDKRKQNMREFKQEGEERLAYDKMRNKEPGYRKVF